MIAALAIGTGLLLVAVTALPLSRSKEKWIRVWDFPRTQIAFLLGATLLAAIPILPLAHPGTWVFLAMLALSLAWQLRQIRPYTPLHAVQVKTAEDCHETARVKVLIANVLKDNRDSGRLLGLVAAQRPDLILLVETDTWWDAQLDRLNADYPHAIRQPQDNAYGMHLFSRFKLEQPQVRYLLDDDIPSIKTGARLPNGEAIVLYGVHPRPPPSADTDKRDAELVVIGREVRRGGEPAIVAGDLNDVAWSRTTHLFQKVSGLLDPRMGRGLFPTFNARWPLLRWPLDHVFISPAFRLISLSVLPSIGSDHFPLLVALCHAPDKAADQPAPEPDASDRAEVREEIAKAAERKD